MEGRRGHKVALSPLEISDDDSSIWSSSTSLVISLFIMNTAKSSVEWTPELVNTLSVKIGRQRGVHQVLEHFLVEVGQEELVEREHRRVSWGID
eukprot:m.458533 g.458533  ORF g.458533 m.458533 type:complete len:94 (+) comp216871_c0_seq1:325-606(+)